MLGAADSREAQTEARTRPSQSRHWPAGGISVPPRPLRADGDRLRRMGPPLAQRHLSDLREVAAAGPTGPGAGPDASAPAYLVSRPAPRGRGLVLREAPARDPGHRGRGRRSAQSQHRPAAPPAWQTSRAAGYSLVGELCRNPSRCVQSFAMQPLSLTSSFLPLCLCSCYAFHLEALPFRHHSIKVTLPCRPAQ